jgi:membrane protease YdiL (CAAX protease family)
MNLKKSKLWRARQKTDLGHPTWVIFNVLFIFVFSQTLAALLVQLFARFINPYGDGSISGSAVAEFFYVLLAEGLAVAFVLFILKRRKLSLERIGLGRRPRWQDLTKGLIGFGAFYALLIIAAGVIGLFFPDINKGTQDVGFNNLNGHLDTLLALLALVLLPPLGEETLIRGYLYSGLRAKLRFIPALLITSLLFGAAHLATGASGVLWGAGLNTFVLSVVLVYLRENSGALYAGMLVHMLNNLVAFGVHFK